MRHFAGRAVDAFQLALGWTVARPIFSLLDAVDPSIVERASHERDANEGRAFIETASALQKALFVGKMLFSYGLGRDALGELEAALALDGAHDGHRGASAEVIFLGDLLFVDDLGKESLSDALRARLRQADRLVINLEGVIGARGNEIYPFQSARGVEQLRTWDRGDASGWKVRFAADRLADFLDGLPPVTFTLANNHSLDDGRAGVMRTVAALERWGADHVGCDCKAGASATVSVGTRRVGLVAIGFGQNHATADQCGLTFTGVPYQLPETQIAAHLNELDADARIAVLHWGYEHEHWPRRDQVACVKRLWELGFDAVIGHHPHIVQPSLGGGRRWVSFSLGDFVGGDRTIFNRYAHAVSFRLFERAPPEVRVLPLVQTPYWAERQCTQLLEEAPLLERHTWRRLFEPKLSRVSTDQAIQVAHASTRTRMG